MSSFQKNKQVFLLWRCIQFSLYVQATTPVTVNDYHTKVTKTQQFWGDENIVRLMNIICYLY